MAQYILGKYFLSNKAVTWLKNLFVYSSIIKECKQLLHSRSEQTLDSNFPIFLF